MGDRLVRAPFFGQRYAQVLLCFGKVRIDIHGYLELLDCFVQTAVAEQKMPESVMRDKIPRGHGEGVLPERLTVAPVRSLDAGGPSQSDNGDASRHCQNSTLEPGNKSVRNRP